MSATPVSQQDLERIHERMLTASIRFWQASREVLESEHRARVVARLEAGDLPGAEEALRRMERAELS